MGFTQANTPPAVWAKIQAAAPAASAKPRGKRKPAAMVEAAHGHDFLSDWWTVPCVLPSLANERQWQTRNRCTQSHRKAVSRVLGTGDSLVALARYAYWLHDGKPLRVTLTRLGGRKLDRTANLPASLKYVEDTVALFLGADDGAANWHCVCEQESGGKQGVRIELSIAPAAA